MTEEDIARDRALCDPGTNTRFTADASRRWPAALDALEAERKHGNEMWRAYLDVADALLPSSNGAGDLIAEARRLRAAERDLSSALAAADARYERRTRFIDAIRKRSAATDEAAASEETELPDPVPVVEWRGNIDYSTADVGPLELTSWRKVGSATWDWDIENGHTLIGKGSAATSDAAKAAAIAAARAWRDSIRL